MNTQKMKAAVCTKYGSPDNLIIKEVAVPTPQPDEVLVKVHATTVTAADTMMRKADPFIARFFLGFTKPKCEIIGTGFAGEIVATGKEVTQFKIGDEIYGETAFKFSANAEYLTVPETGVIITRPENVPYEALAPISDGPLTSYNFLKNLGNIQAGQKVLINGASGSLGTAAVQIAKYYGAEVTGVCSSSNVELVKSLGADKVIDYTKEDFTENIGAYDLIYDTVGKSRFSKCKKALSPEGQYLSPVLDLGLLFQVIKTSIVGKKKAKFYATGTMPAPKLRSFMEEIKEMIKKGKLKSIIDKRYPLDAIAEAHRYVDSGRKRGNVVITVA